MVAPKYRLRKSRGRLAKGAWPHSICPGVPVCVPVCVKVHACHKMPLIMLAINFYSLDATAGIQWTVVGWVFVYFFSGLGVFAGK